MVDLSLHRGACQNENAEQQMESGRNPEYHRRSVHEDRNEDGSGALFSFMFRLCAPNLSDRIVPHHALQIVSNNALEFSQETCGIKIGQPSSLHNGLHLSANTVADDISPSLVQSFHRRF